MSDLFWQVFGAKGIREKVTNREHLVYMLGFIGYDHYGIESELGHHLAAGPAWCPPIACYHCDGLKILLPLGNGLKNGGSFSANGCRIG